MIRGARHYLATEGNVDDSEALVLYGAENASPRVSPASRSGQEKDSWR
jgi:hypothetical protein